MREIAKAIQVGANAFLIREYTYLAIFVGFVAVLLLVFVHWATAICFVIGAVVSASCGFLGMWVAVRANVRTACAAQDSLNEALRIAFNSGSIMGLAVVGGGITTLSILYAVFGNVQYLAGFSFGASSIALFARVGGGIYTKAADVGADLVGKVEAGIPEDDPRNPAVIADNVGDNVGDVAGMGADLFESYVGSIVAAATLGYETYGSAGVIYPFAIAAMGILCSIGGCFCVRTKENANQGQLLWSIRLGILAAGVAVFCGTIILTVVCRMEIVHGLCVLIGLVAGVLIGFFTEYATSFAYAPTLSIVESGKTGPATVVIQGMAVGMQSSVPIVITLATALAAAVFLTNNTYGVALAGVGMLSTLGVTLATDAYGPVADNAGGIAEMAGLPEEVRERTDALDALGNTTAATGKGFAIGSAVLTALALMSAYSSAVGVTSLDLIQSKLVIPGMLLGAMMPFWFAALTMTSVGRSAGAIIQEVRRQFRDIPGLLEGTAVADYAKCVAISTDSSLREMVYPGLLAVITPMVVGLCLGAWGPTALAGLLAGSIITGFLLAVTMANAGGSWDNAKKYCESGRVAGCKKGSDTHKACVVGDTVGDPFKDTSGPALNILLKLMSIVALVLAPLLREVPALIRMSMGAVILTVALVSYAVSYVVKHYLSSGAGSVFSAPVGSQQLDSSLMDSDGEEETAALTSNMEGGTAMEMLNQDLAGDNAQYDDEEEELEVDLEV
jgi:K(+)-stimulated pyrophosphate-energized sodium pump